MSGFAPGSRAARLAMQSGNVRLAESDSDTDSVSSGGTAISNTLVATDSEEEAVGYDAVRGTPPLTHCAADASRHCRRSVGALGKRRCMCDCGLFVPVLG